VQHVVQFGHGPEDVLVSTSGVASVEGVDAAVTALLADARYRPGMDLIVDQTELEANGLPQDDVVRRLYVSLKNADLIGPSRLAVVAERARAGAVPGLNGLDWGTFRTVEDARAWLDDEPPAAA
jgi:hypothetical protein